MNVAGAAVDLVAYHTDPIGDEGRHQHTWTVTAWKPAEPWFDLRALREALKAVLQAIAPGGELPPELWSSEAIARVVFIIEGVVRVTIDRPGFRVDFDTPP
jgi:hypothetical protein